MGARGGPPTEEGVRFPAVALKRFRGSGILLMVIDGKDET